MGKETIPKKEGVKGYIETAVVLAAGRQKRMLDYALPKALAGEVPVLSRSLARVGNAGIGEVLILTHRGFLGDFLAWQKNYSDAGLDIQVKDNGLGVTDESRGALGDLLIALEMVENRGHEGPLLIVPSDTYTTEDFLPELLSVAQENPEAFITVYHDLGSREAIANRLGCVEVDGLGNVVSFEEKPVEPKSSKAAVPYYVLPAGFKAVLKQYLDTGNNPDAPGMIIPWLIKNRFHVKAIGLPRQGSYIDVASVADIKTYNQAAESEIS